MVGQLASVLLVVLGVITALMSTASAPCSGW
jgi:hypothetical protein